MAVMAADEPTLATGVATATRARRVERERVTDAVTGLPVLRYCFDGPPTLRPGMPSPAGAWRVLRVDERDGRTTLDFETTAGADPVDLRPSRIDDGVVEAALATLARARSCGVSHGDLGPHRLWRRGDHVWIEGYGVRWRDAADAESDARDLAAGLLGLSGTRLSAAMRGRLEAVLAHGDVGATVGAPGGEAPPADDVSPLAPAAGAHSEPAPNGDTWRVVRGPPPGARVRRGGYGMRAIGGAAVQAWATRAERAITRFGHDATTLARHLTARHAPSRAAPGTSAATERGLSPRHRRVLTVALAIGALTWFALATLDERLVAATAVTPRATPGHVVDVSIDPEGGPPVSLVVVASPTGSRFAPGSVIASVPSRVWLDLDGRWRFEVRSGDRRSPVIDLILPFERALRLAFPQPAAP